jgi:uncharacterized delta-60 repeat protein
LDSSRLELHNISKRKSELILAQALSVIIHSDDKVLLAGNFDNFNGASRHRLVRLNSDGSVDLSFEPGDAATSAYRLALQEDGKILVGGGVSTVSGMLIRLNEDGSKDESFGSELELNGLIQSIALQLDGKVLIGGRFTAINGIGRNRIARLNADGSLDIAFNPGNGANGAVHSVLVQPDGQVLLGGAFTSVNDVGRWHVARLHGGPSLMLSSPSRLPDGRFRYTILGEAGRTYLIEFSPDLVNWFELETVVPDDHAFDWTDTSVNPAQQRFYRAKRKP